MGPFATPSAWYPFAPASQRHEPLKAPLSEPIRTTRKGGLHPSLLSLSGLRRLLDPKPARPLNLGCTRHRSRPPAQAGGCLFIVIAATILRIGQKVTSMRRSGTGAKSGAGDGRRGVHGGYGHSGCGPADRATDAPPPGSGGRRRVRLPASCSHMSLSAPSNGSHRKVSPVSRVVHLEEPGGLRPPRGKFCPFVLVSVADAARFGHPSQCARPRLRALQPFGNRVAMHEGGPGSGSGPYRVPVGGRPPRESCES